MQMNFLPGCNDGLVTKSGAVTSFELSGPRQITGLELKMEDNAKECKLYLRLDVLGHWPVYREGGSDKV